MQTNEQRGAGSQSGREVARSYIGRQRINQALWAEYGGRVIFQQFGPEPVDAYRRLLEEHQRRGTFTIVDPALVPGFWEYVTNDGMHTFVDEKEGRELMTKPWWQRLGEAPPDAG